jgi:S-formylglutathione hydrolase FrmB
MNRVRALGGSRLLTAFVISAASSVIGCAGTRSAVSNPVRAAQVPDALAPEALLGAFTDDYGGNYRITSTAWQHGKSNRYDVVAWYPDSQFVIARNAETNPTDAGRWTRIDWMPLEGMAPYTWAFCLSAYKAPTREAAQTTRAANRGTPRTGCSGFPFSRMQRVPE